MKFLINTRRQYLTLIVIAVLQRLVIQELETRVQQLTQESEGLQSSRSKLAKEKVIKLITVALVVVTCGPSVCTAVAVILSRETYFRCILMLINSFKFILEACDIVAMKIATSFSVLENFIGQPYVRHLVGVAIHSLLPIDSQCKQLGCISVLQR